jgi:hypothetical protein
MKKQLWVILFLILGVLFASGSFYFAMLPGPRYHPQLGSSGNANSGYGAIAMAIAAAGCFICCGNIIKGEPKKD